VTECRYEPRTPRYRATTMLAGGLVVLLAAIYLSVEFDAQVRRVNWAIVTGVCGGAFFFYMFYRGASDPKNTIEPWDMILDPVTRRISLWRVLILVAFALGVWTMGQWVITGDVPPDADKILYLYGTILGSLVAKVASGEWADVKANRQPVPAGSAPPPAPDSPIGTVSTQAPQ